MLKALELGLSLPSEEEASSMLAQVKRLSEDQKRLVSEDEFKEIYFNVIKTK